MVEKATGGAMIELDIKWNGAVNGLAEHRLSVGAFARPLELLLAALRRTAHNMVREATERKSVDIGRLAAEASQIDIEITAITEGSAGIQSLVSVQLPSGQQELWPEGLAADAADKILHDIEQEARGIQRNARVREYMRALPTLAAQEYVLKVDGTERRRVHLGIVELTLEIAELPHLIEILGRVIGVGFEPGRNFVRIKASDDSGSETTLAAASEQVSKALEVREQEVRVLAIASTGAKRLLRLQLSREPVVKLGTQTFIFDRWEALLERLAQ